MVTFNSKSTEPKPKKPTNNSPKKSQEIFHPISSMFCDIAMSKA